LASTLTIAQDIPTDFRLELEFNAGMYPFRETLILTSSQGSYRAFEQGKHFKFAFLAEDTKAIETLYAELKECGFFKLKLKSKDLIKPESPTADKSKKTLSVHCLGKGYYLNKSVLKNLNKRQEKIVNKAFEVLKAFTKQYRS